MEKRAEAANQKREVQSLQTYREGDKIYVVTYFMDQTVTIKMYELSRSTQMYNYIGMIDVVA